MSQHSANDISEHLEEKALIDREELAPMSALGRAKQPGCWEDQWRKTRERRICPSTRSHHTRAMTPAPSMDAPSLRPTRPTRPPIVARELSPSILFLRPEELLPAYWRVRRAQPSDLDHLLRSQILLESRICLRLSERPASSTSDRRQLETLTPEYKGWHLLLPSVARGPPGEERRRTTRTWA